MSINSINSINNTSNYIINNYFYFGYKWNDILLNKLSSQHQLMKFNINNMLDLIDINVVYDNFKIVSLTAYNIPPNIINYNKKNYKELTLEFVNNANNFNIISRYNINIIENDKNFIITDDAYNIYNINDSICSASGYMNNKHTIQSLLINILEPI